MNVLNNIMDFVADGLIKIVGQFPSAPFSFESHVSALRDFWSYANWFIPFYEFKVIFNGWLLVFFLCVSVMITIKVIMKFS